MEVGWRGLKGEKKTSVILQTMKINLKKKKRNKGLNPLSKVAIIKQEEKQVKMCLGSQVKKVFL